LHIAQADYVPIRLAKDERPPRVWIAPSVTPMDLERAAKLLKLMGGR
jgi:hypothetical protein